MCLLLGKLEEIEKEKRSYLLLRHVKRRIFSLSLSLSLPFRSFCYTPKGMQKQSQQLSTSQSDCEMVEVCDICGHVGRADKILIFPKYKTSREHGYCRIIFSNNRTDDWSCDECMEKRKCSSKTMGKDVHTKLASTFGKVKGIASHQVIMLSSRSKRLNVPIRISKVINNSSTEISEPSTSSYRNGPSLKSPAESMLLPCKRPVKSVIPKQGSRILHVPKGW